MSPHARALRFTPRARRDRIDPILPRLAFSAFALAALDILRRPRDTRLLDVRADNLRTGAGEGEFHRMIRQPDARPRSREGMPGRLQGSIGKSQGSI